MQFGLKSQTTESELYLPTLLLTFHFYFFLLSETVCIWITGTQKFTKDTFTWGIRSSFVHLPLQELVLPCWTDAARNQKQQLAPYLQQITSAGQQRERKQRLSKARPLRTLPRPWSRAAGSAPVPAGQHRHSADPGQQLKSGTHTGRTGWEVQQSPLDTLPLVLTQFVTHCNLHVKHYLVLNIQMRHLGIIIIP